VSAFGAAKVATTRRGAGGRAQGSREAQRGGGYAARLTADGPCGCQFSLGMSGSARTLDAVNVVYVEREPSRLEQLAYKADLFPRELRELLRAEVERRRTPAAPQLRPSHHPNPPESGGTEPKHEHA
jgi:hypothetical protein